MVISSLDHVVSISFAFWSSCCIGPTMNIYKISSFYTLQRHARDTDDLNREREYQILLCNKFIKVNHQILIIFVGHVNLSQASKAEPWVWSKGRKGEEIIQGHVVSMIKYTYTVACYHFLSENHKTIICCCSCSLEH